MDIRLTDDAYISRDNHFSIVYDPKTNKFSFVPGGGETHINNMVVNSVQQLCEDDVLEAGQTKYLFVPYRIRINRKKVRIFVFYQTVWAVCREEKLRAI